MRHETHSFVLVIGMMTCRLTSFCSVLSVPCVLLLLFFWHAELAACQGLCKLYMFLAYDPMVVMELGKAFLMEIMLQTAAVVSVGASWSCKGAIFPT